MFFGKKGIFLGGRDTLKPYAKEITKLALKTK